MHLKQFVIASLQHPMLDGAFCLVGWVNLILSGYIEDHIPSEAAEIVGPMMDFIGTPRSPGELLSLKQKLSCCQCDLRDESVAWLHSRPLPAPWNLNLDSEDDHAFTYVVCKFMELLARHIWYLKPNVYRKDTKQNPRWPKDFADLCRPSGDCTKAISNLTQWTRIPISYSLLVVRCTFPVLDSVWERI